MNNYNILSPLAKHLAQNISPKIHMRSAGLIWVEIRSKLEENIIQIEL